jgi:hypothetical protein
MDMISSKFILDILDLLLDGDETGKALRPQVEHLIDAEYNYTGVGLFVTFQTTAGIESYKYKEDRVILDGVSITSTELGVGASAIIFVSKGVITTLEIWSYDGKYPMGELTNYTLKQKGTWSSGRDMSVGPGN